MSIKVRITNCNDVNKSNIFIISKVIEESAKVRRTGISKRRLEYLMKKVLEGNAIFAYSNNILSGFSYIEAYREDFITHSGMIVFPRSRSKGISTLLKCKMIKLSYYKYPKYKIMSITTNPLIYKLNLKYGMKSVSFISLTQAYKFWNNCKNCINFKILTINNKDMCLCNGFLYKPKRLLKYRILLAYSGGLDTSYCLKYLTEQGYEVYTAQVNTGGFSKLEIKNIEENAYNLGAKYHRSIDAIDFYYDNCIKYLIYGNILRNNIYPLSVSSERIFQAIKVAEYANEIEARAIAHGSTCTGNDQIRFDLAFKVLCPNKYIISLIRDHQCSREEEINYLYSHGVDILWKKARYSVNRGLWGLSVGGDETLTSEKKLPSDAFPLSLQEMESITIQLGFQKGEFISLNNERSSTVNNIVKLERISSKFAIGRDTHIGDTIIGIKGRVGMQASSALIIIKAHELLEKYLLTKWQIYWKDQLSNWYGMLLHEAQYMEPVMRNIEAFLRESQTRVCGEIFIRLYPYRFEFVGVKSEFDLLQIQKARYGEINDEWISEDVKGFIELFGKQIALYHNI